MMGEMVDLMKRMKSLTPDSCQLLNFRKNYEERGDEDGERAGTDKPQQLHIVHLISVSDSVP